MNQEDINQGMTYDFLHYPAETSQQYLYAEPQHYPPTPYPIFQEPQQLTSPIQTERVKVNPSTGEQRCFHHSLQTSSPFSREYSSRANSKNVSPIELLRVMDSVISQVDWLEVARQVGKKRAPSIYCSATERMFIAQMNQLIRAEQETEWNGTTGNDQYVCKDADKHEVEGKEKPTIVESESDEEYNEDDKDGDYEEGDDDDMDDDGNDAV